MIFAAGLSDIGCRREANEDRILLLSDDLVFAVADGMGGERCGARAAELATAAMDEYFRSPATTVLQPAQERMATAIRLANERILRESIWSTECAGMGCTISAVNINGDLATVGSVGDSRVYLFRSGELVQVTRDDSVLQNLLAAGAITPEETPLHPMRNLLTQCVGVKDAVDIQIMEFPLLSGDRLLICSDGLHAVVGDRAIYEMLASTRPPEMTAQELIAAARDCGGPDNISCVVIDCQL